MTGNEGLTYGYTQTLKPSFYNMSVVRQLYNTYSDIQHLIRHKLKVTNYKIYIEFTKEGNVHYHGVLFGCNQSRILRNKHLFTERIGFCSFILNNDFCKLMKYITKSIDIAKEVFPNVKMPLTDDTRLAISDHLNDVFAA